MRPPVVQQLDRISERCVGPIVVDIFRCLFSPHFRPRVATSVVELAVFETIARAVDAITFLSSAVKVVWTFAIVYRRVSACKYFA
jgi:hypothetical protein